MTALSSIQLQLLIGKFVPLPAPEVLMNTLQSVEITQSDVAGFQMTFRVEPSLPASMDFSVVSNQLLQPGSRVVISATINVTPRVLIDGIITNHQFAYDGSGAMLFTVTGEDISVMMDLFELSLEYPGMGDAAIAFFVLVKYAAFGVTPLIIPPLTNVIDLPIERIPQQNSSDRDYLRSLAAEHGYIFSIQPGPVPMQSIAYWGPIGRIGQVQRTLTIDAGPFSNVEALNFSYDALAPTQVYGAVSDEESEMVLPLLTLGSSRMPPFASMPPWVVNQPFVRKSLLDYQGSSYLDALARAQALTDQANSAVVTASGTLNVLRFGDILSAPGIVSLRGAGFSYDGYYTITSVSHHISIGQYTQDFALAREGLGSTTTGVMP